MNKQMQYFVTLVETHNFTKAADLCFISQSAMSQQIKSLEDYLGVPLLLRDKKSFSLTPSGEYFYKQSKDILDLINQTCKKTKEIADDENVLKIGYLRGYYGKEIKETIIDFSSLYPHVAIDLKRGNHEELYNYLINHEIHLAISDQRRSFNDTYINYHLLNMDCYIEISDQDPISTMEYVDVEQLTKTVCILVASQEQQEIEREFYENIIGLKCQYLFAEGIEEARLLVAINKGFMPVEDLRNINQERDNIKLIPLYRDEKQLQRNYCAFWKKNRGNYYIEEFADMLRNKMQKYSEE